MFQGGVLSAAVVFPQVALEAEQGYLEAERPPRPGR